MPGLVTLLGRGPVEPSAPVVPADDHGLTRGDGCFEGLRIVRGPDSSHAEDLDAHLDRMASSAGALGIPFDSAAWEGAVADIVGRWHLAFPRDPEAALKLVLTRGPEHDPASTGVLTVSPMAAAVGAARRGGIAVATMSRGYASDAFDQRPWLLGGVKTLSYAVNLAAVREAQRRGAEDALFVTTDGLLLEGPTWSVAWLDGDGVLTTVAPGANGVLRSVTATSFLSSLSAAGVATAWAQGTPGDLLASPLVLALSSVRGAVRVHTVDGTTLPVPDGGVAASILGLASRRWGAP